MQKILKLVEPPVKTYQFLAYPLSIILANKEAWPWFYSNFIQLYSTNKFNITIHNHGEFDNYPWLSVTEWENERFACERQLIDSIIKSVENENYVYLFVDEFFIENTTAFQKDTYIHDILIHGYDDEKSIFYVSGFTKNGTYSFYTVSFESIMKATLTEKLTLHRKVTLLQYKKYRYDNYTYLSYHFDLNNIVEQLEDYLYNRNSSLRFRMNQNPNNFLYGIQVYNVLRKQIERAQHTNNMGVIPFHCIYEHKLIMRNRIQFLKEKLSVNLDIFLIWANELLNATLIIRNLTLKYEITNDKDVLTAIKKNIEEVEPKEYRLIVRLIQKLKESLVTQNTEYLSFGNDFSDVDDTLWLEHLVNLSKDKDNYPRIYDIIANLPAEVIQKAYIRDKSRVIIVITIFLESMLERKWKSAHIEWFIEKCERLCCLIDEQDLKNLIYMNLQKIAEMNDIQYAQEAYSRLLQTETDL